MFIILPSSVYFYKYGLTNSNLLGGAKELRRQRNIYVYATWLSWFNLKVRIYQRVFSLKVPKCEIFHRSDFHSFYTIKPFWIDDFGVKILTYFFKFWGSQASFSFLSAS
jgi:hypothetical protein